MAPISTVTSTRMPQDLSDLPIRQRGLFLNDHFFRDSREHFQQAMEKVLRGREDQNLSDWHSNKLTNWDEDIFSDRLKRYRSLRKDHIKTESQAVTETSNEYQHRIIIDVREFMHGSMNISIVGDRELLVKGSIEETTSGVTGKRTFEKKFLLPSETILSETTSAMSSDGILTIISPKKVVENERKECKKEALSKHQINQNKQTASNQKHSLFADDFMDEFLPISRRGHFFSDSVFKDAHHDYNKAVQDVLERWNKTSEDESSSYRNLRRQSLKDENQAVTEKDNHQVYQIVIDVHDFVTDGEVNVKVLNNKYLEVEGCIDKEEEETVSKKNFKRRFTLPRNTDIKNISSLLSSDGVLTITSPKMIEHSDFKETIIPVKHESFRKKESSDSTSDAKSKKSSATNNNETHSSAAKECITNIKYNLDSEKSKIMKQNNNIKVIIPVTLNETDDCNEFVSNQNNKEENKMEGNMLSYINQPLNTINKEGDKSSDTESELSEAASEVSYLKDYTSHNEHTNMNSSSKKGSGRECIVPVNMETEDEVLEIDSNKSKVVKVEEQTYKQGSVEESNEASMNSEHEKRAFDNIPIVRRGPFCIDSFFNESQKNFEKAVQNVLQKSGFNSRENDLQFYRSLRERSNSEKNQANDCTEDDKSFKIVIDVQDFENDDIKIKVHSANELTVEGEQNQNKNHTLFKRKFCRKFVFPSHIICNDITSAVSEDGILTINAPKKIKETCDGAMSDETVKSVLISDDSNNGLNNSDGKYVNIELKDRSNKLESHNSEFLNCVDTCEHEVDEDGQTLPITRRGSFFTDPYFEDSRLVFKNAISNIIAKSGFTSKDDDFSFYKSMLERSSDKNNQASTITESDNVYKIVLDIQGFSADEIKTQFSSSTDLIIEATNEKNEEGSTSTRKFRRCFVFPNSVNIEAVTTSLSSDGILTISAPRKIVEETKADESCSAYDEKNLSLNNGWEDEKTHQSSSERDGVRTKTFSKCKSSYKQINKST